MRQLLLTLGHNSSAILIENNKIVWGYETERITKIKSDSVFPEAIFKSKNVYPKNVDKVYVTHWDPLCNLRNCRHKHWNYEYFDGVPIRTLSTEFTHHDSHIYAAMLFAGNDFCDEDTIGIVCDGFGNFGEHLSIYDFKNGRPKLRHRFRGYNSSLGLFYQYATAFMHLKMHEDEYKLLGYEAHINEIPHDVYSLRSDIIATASQYISNFNTSIYMGDDDPLYNLNALQITKDYVYKILTDVCRKYGILDPSAYDSRVILSFFVQSVLEEIFKAIIHNFKFKKLLLSGGVFYNVKLNKILTDNTPEKICIYPLCGDQGNALGLYFLDNPSFAFDHSQLTYWGQRTFSKADVNVKNLHIISNEHDAFDLCAEFIHEHGHVNLIRGNMEFGPRALCNTSTLALPSSDIVRKINAANGRNTVMPMAPVVTESFYKSNFVNANKIHNSEKYMITALQYESTLDVSMYEGAAHVYPDGKHTGRPQVINAHDVELHNLVSDFGGALINTSFNIHGVPIAYDMPSIIHNHLGQVNNDSSFHTVVIANDQ